MVSFEWGMVSNSKNSKQSLSCLWFCRRALESGDRKWRGTKRDVNKQPLSCSPKSTLRRIESSRRAPNEWNETAATTFLCFLSANADDDDDDLVSWGGEKCWNVSDLEQQRLHFFSLPTLPIVLDLSSNTQTHHKEQEQEYPCQRLPTTTTTWITLNWSIN